MRTKPKDSRVVDVEESHPAYAMINASRVTGRMVLAGSDFVHRNYMTISIHRSMLMRSLSHDWWFPREEYIEVALSEAQWATFVSTPNAGSGIPCTLTRRSGELIPDLPDPVQPTEKFKQEASEDAQEALAELANLRAAIGTMKVSDKAKKELTDRVDRARRKLEDSIPWVARSFSEHLETTKEQAKVEIEAYLQNAITRTGLQAIAAASGEKLAPFELPGDHTTEHEREQLAPIDPRD